MAIFNNCEVDGEHNAMSKLTLLERQCIKEAKADRDKFSAKRLARVYNVGTSTIFKYWREV
jgi:hypothetical protein